MSIAYDNIRADGYGPYGQLANSGVPSFSGMDGASRNAEKWFLEYLTFLSKAQSLMRDHLGYVDPRTTFIIYGDFTALSEDELRYAAFFITLISDLQGHKDITSHNLRTSSAWSHVGYINELFLDSFSVVT